MHAILEISKDEIERIRTEAMSATVHPVFVVPIVDDNDTVVARVTKTLYVRRRRTRGNDTAD